MVREEGEEDRLTMETLITALREVSRAGQAVPGDRYRLRPLYFYSIFIYLASLMK